MGSTSPPGSPPLHQLNHFSEIMRAFIVLIAVSTASAQGINFGSSSSTPKPVNTRLGLLGTSLGLSPTAEQTSSGLTQGTGNSGQTSGAFTQGGAQAPTGRVPSGGEFTGSFSQCCCVPLAEQCGDPLGRDIVDYDYDLVGSGLIDPRVKPLKELAKEVTPNNGLGLRIVNRPSADTNSNQPQTTCPVGQKACCYDPSVDHSVFGRSCVSPGASQNLESVFYGCNPGFPQPCEGPAARRGLARRVPLDLSRP